MIARFGFSPKIVKNPTNYPTTWLYKTWALGLCYKHFYQLPKNFTQKTFLVKNFGTLWMIFDTYLSFRRNYVFTKRFSIYDLTTKIICQSHSGRWSCRKQLVQFKLVHFIFDFSLCQKSTKFLCYFLFDKTIIFFIDEKMCRLFWV